jgi:hypothetical protein
MCQSPPTRSRRLASGLHRNSEYRSRCSALASQSDALGAIDKCPVSLQLAGTRAFSTTSVLASVWTSCSEPGHERLERYRVGKPSLFSLREVPKPTQEYSHTGIKNRKGGGASSSRFRTEVSAPKQP